MTVLVPPDQVGEAISFKTKVLSLEMEKVGSWQPWDPSVQTLAGTPDVVQRLAGNVQLHRRLDERPFG